MKTLMMTSAVALAFLLAGDVERVEAQGYVGSSCPTCYGNFGLLGSPYALGRVPTPPYFALHPPVYYSQPVPRTYGYSPFAYPASVMTPAAPTATAQVIHNPYVPAKVETKKSLDVDMAQHLEIINPHVKATRMVSRDVH